MPDPFCRAKRSWQTQHLTVCKCHDDHNKTERKFVLSPFPPTGWHLKGLLPSHCTLCREPHLPRQLLHGCLVPICSQICGTLSSTPSRCVPQQLGCTLQMLFCLFVPAVCNMNASWGNCRAFVFLLDVRYTSDWPWHICWYLFLAEALLFVVLVDLQSAFADLWSRLAAHCNTCRSWLVLLTCARERLSPPPPQHKMGGGGEPALKAAFLTTQMEYCWQLDCEGTGNYFFHSFSTKYRHPTVHALPGFHPLHHAVPVF